MTFDVDRIEAGDVELDGNELVAIYVEQVFPVMEIPVEVEDEFLECRGPGAADGGGVKVWEEMVVGGGDLDWDEGV